MINRSDAIKAVRELMWCLEVPETEHTCNTPTRIVDAYDEFFNRGKEDFTFTTFEAKARDMVLEMDLHFYSLCAHHFLPFFGTVAIAYIPNKRIAGLSKLARTVTMFSHRPQVQEELGAQIVDFLCEKLATPDVAVIIEAEHLCMSMRGANSPGHTTKTATLRGAFMDDRALRGELYALMRV